MSLCVNSSKKEKGKKEKQHKKSITESPTQRGVTISRPTTAVEVRRNCIFMHHYIP